MRRNKVLAATLALILFVLHNNWWSWEADLTLVFGRIPIEIFYRILWVIAAIGVLWLVLNSWWPERE